MVQATGKKEFHTPQMARRLGLRSDYERCDIALVGSANLRALYFDNEKYDGYFRNRCVVRPEIDIEDTMNVMARYNTGVTSIVPQRQNSSDRGPCFAAVAAGIPGDAVPWRCRADAAQGVRAW